jgi:hypothetical protein
MMALSLSCKHNEKCELKKSHNNVKMKIEKYTTLKWKFEEQNAYWKKSQYIFKFLEFKNAIIFSFCMIYSSFHIEIFKLSHDVLNQLHV